MFDPKRRCVPADDALRLVGRLKHALKEVVGLDFQKRVVGVDAVSPKCLEHELALPPESISIGGKANLSSIASTKRGETPSTHQHPRRYRTRH